MTAAGFSATVGQLRRSSAPLPVIRGKLAAKPTSENLLHRVAGFPVDEARFRAQLATLDQQIGDEPRSRCGEKRGRCSRRPFRPISKA
jgi:hypothetical protein